MKTRTVMWNQNSSLLLMVPDACCAQSERYYPCQLPPSLASLLFRGPVRQTQLQAHGASDQLSGLRTIKGPAHAIMGILDADFHEL